MEENISKVIEEIREEHTKRLLKSVKIYDIHQLKFEHEENYIVVKTNFLYSFIIEDFNKRGYELKFVGTVDEDMNEEKFYRAFFTPKK